MADPQDESPQTPSPEDLKRANKAFKNRFKAT
jgi:hypothetical protein